MITQWSVSIPGKPFCAQFKYCCVFRFIFKMNKYVLVYYFFSKMLTVELFGVLYIIIYILYLLLILYRVSGLTEKTPFLCRYLEVLGQQIFYYIIWIEWGLNDRHSELLGKSKNDIFDIRSGLTSWFTSAAGYSAPFWKKKNVMNVLWSCNILYIE